MDITVNIKQSQWILLDAKSQNFGFTATVTKHHEGDKSLDRFWICNEMPEKKSLIASQAWLGNVIEYPFVKHSGRFNLKVYW